MKQPGSFILLLSLILSCKTSHSSKAAALDVNSESSIRLSLNDVSILMPYTEKGELITKVPSAHDKPQPEVFAPGLPAAPLDDEPFVPERLRAALDKNLLDDLKIRVSEEYKFGGEGSSEFREQQFIEKTPGYQLVSVRIDPCANIIDTKGDPLDLRCMAQIRIIWQATNRDPDPEKFQAFDNNIHAVYQLSALELREVVATLRQLRRDSAMDIDSEPLEPHPIIKKQGADGLYFKGIIALVHRYARGSKLQFIAFFADTQASLQGHWPMTLLSVKESEALRIPLAAVMTEADETPKFVQRMNGRGAILEDAAPSGSNPENLLVKLKRGSSIDERQAWQMDRYRRSFLIENPNRHDVFDMDCASCHRASTERRVMEDLLSKKQIAISPPAEAFTQSHWNLENKTNRDIDQTALQMFSYFNFDFRITHRVINESAQVADLINQHF